MQSVNNDEVKSFTSGVALGVATIVPIAAFDVLVLDKFIPYNHGLITIGLTAAAFYIAHKVDRPIYKLFFRKSVFKDSANRLGFIGGVAATLLASTPFLRHAQPVNYSFTDTNSHVSLAVKNNNVGIIPKFLRTAKSEPA